MISENDAMVILLLKTAVTSLVMDPHYTLFQLCVQHSVTLSVLGAVIRPSCGHPLQRHLTQQAAGLLAK